MLRRGVPTPLRCAIWISNIICTVHPQYQQQQQQQQSLMSLSSSSKKNVGMYWYQEYRTLAKVQALDKAYESVLQSMGMTEPLTPTVHNHNKNIQQEEEKTHSVDLRTAPTFGARNTDNFHHEGHHDTINKETCLFIPHIVDISPQGLEAYTRVLLALERTIGLEQAPMVPTLVALLLTHMSESYAFCAIREMTHAVEWYFPIDDNGRRIVQYRAWQSALEDVLRKLHKSTFVYLQDRGVFDPVDADSGITLLTVHVFQNFFTSILPLSAVYRILDIYTLEGYKVLFRFAITLSVLFKMEVTEKVLLISNAEDWWREFRTWSHDPARFPNFDYICRKAYGLHGKAKTASGRSSGRQMRFPRRHILSRIIKMEEERFLQQFQELDEQHGPYGGSGSSSPVPPLGLILPQQIPKSTSSSSSSYHHYEHLLLSSDHGGWNSASSEEDAKAQPILAASTLVRSKLAEWLPLTLRMTNMQLVYSTNHHGRSLDMFYQRVKHLKHTLLLCEAYPLRKTSDTRRDESNSVVVVGMYASQAWVPSTHVYGDGGCFLFRLGSLASGTEKSSGSQASMSPQCWKWKPTLPVRKDSNGPVNSYDLLEESESHYEEDNQTALLEQFMVGTRTYISMGGNPDGSAGLRFNEDFTRGESSTASGFNNEPLHGLDAGSVFEVGLLEVYGLVRQIDGRSA